MRKREILCIIGICVIFLFTSCINTQIVDEDKSLKAEGEESTRTDVQDTTSAPSGNNGIKDTSHVVKPAASEAKKGFEHGFFERVQFTLPVGWERKPDGRIHKYIAPDGMIFELQHYGYDFLLDDALKNEKRIFNVEPEKFVNSPGTELYYFKAYLKFAENIKTENYILTNYRVKGYKKDDFSEAGACLKFLSENFTDEQLETIDQIIDSVYVSFDFPYTLIPYSFNGLELSIPDVYETIEETDEYIKFTDGDEYTDVVFYLHTFGKKYKDKEKFVNDIINNNSISLFFKSLEEVNEDISRDCAKAKKNYEIDEVNKYINPHNVEFSEVPGSGYQPDVRWDSHTLLAMYIFKSKQDYYGAFFVIGYPIGTQTTMYKIINSIQ